MLNSSALYGLTKACAHAFFPPCGWHASCLGSVVMPLVEKVEGVCRTPSDGASTPPNGGSQSHLRALTRAGNSDAEEEVRLRRTLSSSRQSLISLRQDGCTTLKSALEMGSIFFHSFASAESAVLRAVVSLVTPLARVRR